MPRTLIRDLAFYTAIGCIIATGAYLTADQQLPFWPLVAIMTALFVTAGLVTGAIRRRPR